MYCPKCGAQMSDQAVFCPKCGNRMSRMPSTVHVEKKNTKFVEVLKSLAVVRLAKVFGDVIVHRSHKLLIVLFLIINYSFTFAGLAFIGDIFGESDSYYESIGSWILVINVLCQILALSRVGDAFLHLLCGASRIKRKDYLDYLRPILMRSIADARAEGLHVSDNIQLYLSSDREPYVYPLGRNSICVSEGALDSAEMYMEEAMRRAVFESVKNNSDLIIAICISGIIGAIMLLAGAAVSFITGHFGRYADSEEDRFEAAIARLAGLALFGLAILWIKLEGTVIKQAIKKSIFEADTFSCKYSDGSDYCSNLEYEKEYAGSNRLLFVGPISLQNKIHFNERFLDMRIEKLQEQGVAYANV